MDPILIVDWNPLVAAAAGLLIALTPILVAYLTVQVNAIKAQHEADHAEAVAQRGEIQSQLDANKRLLEQQAITTPNTIKNRRITDS